MYRHYYNAEGRISEVYEYDQSKIIKAPEDDGRTYIDLTAPYDPSKWYVDINDDNEIRQIPVEQQMPTLSRQYSTDWATQRRLKYGTAEQQMNWLYDDIDSGKFGEAAKTGKWYLHVKAVKENNPKD